MWTSMPRRSYFVFVRIRKNGKGFTIPIFLPVLDVTLEAVADLAWLWEKTAGVFRGKVLSQPHLSRTHKSFLTDFQPFRAVALCREVIDELRRMGRWRAVEVNTGDFEITIDLY